MFQKRYAVVDIETTGNAPKKGDRIMQVAIVTVENDRIIDEYSSFVNPQQPIPPFIEELTGISDQMVRHAPLFHEVAEEIVKRLNGSVFVAHNVQFDLPFLQNELQEAGYSPWSGNVIDTVELSRMLLPTTESFKLSDLTGQFAIAHDRPHQADSDALVTAELLLSFIDKIHTLPLVTLEKMTGLAAFLKSDIDLLLRDALLAARKVLPPLKEGIAVHRGLAFRKRTLTSPEPLPHITASYEEKISRIYSEGVIRPDQIGMMEDIEQAIKERKHIAIEAGTGIGKSMGYLLPAIHSSNGERIVVSTQTVHLQEQLLSKELKKVNALYDDKLQIALLKGRRHYLHLFKFEQSLQENETQYDVVMTKLQLLTWLLETATGDVDELNLSSGGRLFWNRIRHDGWDLGKEQDPWHDFDYYEHAVKRAEHAHIIVTNHAMLVHDARREKPMLPQNRLLVLDEAHHVEETCRNQWGEQLDFIGFKYMLGQLGTPEAPLLLAKLVSVELELTGGTEATGGELIQHVQEEADEAFHLLTSCIKRYTKPNGRKKVMLTLDESIRQTPEWKAATYAFERLLSELKKVARWIDGKRDVIKKEKKKLTDSHRVLMEEIHSYRIEWDEWMTVIRTFFVKPPADHVKWLEADLRSLPGSIQLTTRKVQISDEIRGAFFSRTDKQLVIMTSATLTVNGSFTFFLSGLGLNSEQVLCSNRPSPFQYEKAVRLMVPEDFPDVKAVPIEEYVEQITDYIIGLGHATKGRMLVLFTSHEMLRRTYDLIKDSGLMEDFVLLAQGITNGSRTKLTRNFQRFDKAILFGTSSFWEGVDIPGEDLSCLVMVRLPFSPPDDPMLKAQAELIEQQGGNAFERLSLPKAVIRFRQGFGRLIRHEQDRGIVVVFDRRLTRSHYGSAFLASLPRLKIERLYLDEMVNEIEEWL